MQWSRRLEVSYILKLCHFPSKAYAKVTHVGNENYATKLANEVKKEKRVASELLGSMNKVTRFTSMLIVPLV